MGGGPRNGIHNSFTFREYSEGNGVEQDFWFYINMDMLIHVWDNAH